MSYQSVILLIIGILNLGLAIIVYWRNRKNLANFYYSMMVFTGSLWVFGNFAYSLFLDQPDIRLAVISIIYICTLVTSFYYFIFTYNFPYKTFKLPRPFLTSLYIFVFLYALVLGFDSNYLIDLSILNTNEIIINLGNYWTFSVIFSLFIISGFIILFKKYFLVEGVYKSQIKYVLWATILTYTLASLTNLITGFWNNFDFHWLGPVFSLINFLVIGWVLFRK